jgi:hypothetical protein
MPAVRCWLLVALAVTLTPLACGGPTFVIAQYPGPTRPRETIAILRVDGASPVQLVSVDGEALAPIADDVRLHIEVLPGEHSVGVANTAAPEQPAGRVRFLAQAGKLYGPAWTAAGAPRMYELDASSGAMLRDVSEMVPVVPPASPPVAPPAAAATPQQSGPLVDDGGVGDVRVGSAIPPAHLAGDDAKSRYTLRWVADAQPFEAFRVADPPVFAQFSGPFTRWAESNAGPLDPGRFVDEALREARSGAPVQALVVEERGPKTSAGIGVGSSFTELSAAYPGARLTRSPEWFEPRPTCSVTVPELPRVAFLLAACADNERGDVTRIVISR